MNSKQILYEYQENSLRIPSKFHKISKQIPYEFKVNSIIISIKFIFNLLGILKNFTLNF
jgi:hypothetical protein